MLSRVYYLPILPVRGWVWSAKARTRDPVLPKIANLYSVKQLGCQNFKYTKIPQIYINNSFFMYDLVSMKRRNIEIN